MLPYVHALFLTESTIGPNRRLPMLPAIDFVADESAFGAGDQIIGRFGG
jgi:hypothetical protein